MTMSLVAWFRRMLGPSSISGVPSTKSEKREVNEVPVSDAGLAAWMAACDAGLLGARRDVHDRGAWDDYWRNHLRVGTIEQGFADQMSSDDTLPGMLARRGSRTILCAGNGISTEATSLVARLAIPGVFVSHEHQGAWRPGDTRTHYAEAWLASRGFIVQSDTGFLDSAAAPRLALLMFSSG